ncbi:cytochrome C [Pseudodesulfovibrio sp. F-1]|uniref:Cytochrome C n=1 Tax=Pseudodesulfovibrio alkaliphilus TaxID=2661613 RepID=A0A7K1KLT9_9BACT|nr:cytochrome c3 family protein [Pseudodesulfovibrio alkaliphilus]MUM77039.1 cytochrome C [Pseudodesulfovibrio alkaliphilus]
MNRRFLPITLLTGTLFALALVGYLIPARSAAQPVRILLENKGGKVIFDHKVHTEMQGRACVDCHHTSGQDPAPPACSVCHVPKFDQSFVVGHLNTIDPKHCSACHHAEATIDNFDHDGHAEDYAANNCQACHHDASIEPTPQTCANCHGQRLDIPTRKDAAHARCANCHDDLFDAGVSGCSACHVRKPVVSPQPGNEKGAAISPRPCSDCHAEQTDQLIPTTATAFHAQCMGCHEEKTSGPYGDDACFRCHMR